jgi:hypothetical protein
LARVSRLAPALTIFGLSLKAAATTFAASAVVSSVAIVGVQEWQQRSADNNHPQTSSSKGKAQPAGLQQPLKSQPTATSPPNTPEPIPELGEAASAKSFAPLPNLDKHTPDATGTSPVAGQPAPRAASNVGSQSPASSATNNQPEPRDRLARETALLERARKALQSAPGTALALAHQHGREFPGGQLRAERMFIEARALQRLGRATEARHKAEQALRQYPKGLYAERVREFLRSLR